MRAATFSRAAAAVLVSLSLVGCGSEPPPEPERPARRPPEPACDDARTELERKGRSGSFLFEESGEAMVEHSRWIAMGDREREALIGLLAVLAACRAPEPVREVEVTIRSQAGAVIAQRRVRPSTDYRAPPR